MTILRVTLFVWTSLGLICTADPATAGPPALSRPALRDVTAPGVELPARMVSPRLSVESDSLAELAQMLPGTTAIPTRSALSDFSTNDPHRSLTRRFEIAEPSVPGISSRFLLAVGILWAGACRVAAFRRGTDGRGRGF